MTGSITGFTGIAVAARELGAALDTFEMMLYRSLIGLAVMGGFVLLTGRLAEAAPRRFGTQALRNIVHFAAQNLWLAAISLIPLAQVFAVEFTTPVIVALAAPFFLGERLTRIRLIAAALGFTGILIVARPFGTGGPSLGALLALGSAFGFAAAAIITKRLTRDISVTGILFWLTLMQSILGLVVAGADGRIALPPAPLAPWVLVLGLGGLVAHLGLTKALSLAPAAFVTPVDFLRLPVIAVVGMLAYAEPFDPFVVLGGLVILVANILNIRSERRNVRVVTATG